MANDPAKCWLCEREAFRDRGGLWMHMYRSHPSEDWQDDFDKKTVNMKKKRGTRKKKKKDERVKRKYTRRKSAEPVAASTPAAVPSHEEQMHIKFCPSCGTRLPNAIIEE